MLLCPGFCLLLRGSVVLDCCSWIVLCTGDADCRTVPVAQDALWLACDCSGHHSPHCLHCAWCFTLSGCCARQVSAQRLCSMAVCALCFSFFSDFCMLISQLPVCSSIDILTVYSVWERQVWPVVYWPCCTHAAVVSCDNHAHKVTCLISFVNMGQPRSQCHL